MHLIRLAPDPGIEELRVYWDSTSEAKNDLHVWGARSMHRFTIGHFTNSRYDTRPGMLAEAMELERQGILVRNPSFLDTLEAEGYDPKTLVFSIRKLGFAPAEIEQDARDAAVDEAWTLIEKARRLLDGIDDTKGVYVLDENEMDNVKLALGEVAGKLGVLLGHPEENDDD